MQAIPVKTNAVCQTGRVLNIQTTPAALFLTPPQESSSLATLPPAGTQPAQCLLSPFAPLSITIPEMYCEAPEGSRSSESSESTISTLTPLSTLSRQTANTSEAGCSRNTTHALLYLLVSSRILIHTAHHRLQDQGLVWIALDTKLVKFSRKSLFRRLHPTGPKPWEN